MKWHAVWQALLAGSLVIVSGSALVGILGARWAAGATLFVAGAQAGTAAYYAALAKTGA
jgi:hypothetical protein